tara:strand:+ start:80 stop:433 length:354 start_codon:yes stop_codon:yes gene_type:complete
MIYNIQKNITGSTGNRLLGHHREDNGNTYKVHSCIINNNDSTTISFDVSLYDGTNYYKIFKDFRVRTGYTVELFDEAFEYPDKYDLILNLDSVHYNIDWISKTEVIEETNQIVDIGL